MCRTQLFFPKTSLGLALALLFFLFSCKIEKDDAPSPEYPLAKGGIYSDPAVRSVGMKEFITINVLNDWESSILTQKGNKRPIAIKEYGNAISRYIHVNEFSFQKLSWMPTNRKVMMAAIFKETLKVENNEIKNKEDIVWYWDSNNKIDNGNISIDNGKIANYIKGKFEFKPVSKEPWLKPGIYILCIFAWDDYGHNIVASSREIPFNVYDYIIN